MLFWKKEATGSAVFKPVMGKNVKCSFGKDGITVIPAF